MNAAGSRPTVRSTSASNVLQKKPRSSAYGLGRSVSAPAMPLTRLTSTMPPTPACAAGRITFRHWRLRPSGRYAHGPRVAVPQLHRQQLPDLLGVVLATRLIVGNHALQRLPADY